MKRTIFLFVLICLTALSGWSQAQEKSLENFLPPDVVMVASVTDLGSAAEAFRDTKLFELLAAFHKEEHPEKPVLAEEWQRLTQLPFFHVVKNKVVIGMTFLAPDKPDKQPVFTVLGSSQGTNDFAAQVEAMLQHEEQEKKMFRLPDQEYQGHKIISVLQSEKGKIEPKFIMVTPGLFIVSNQIENLKISYDRILNKKEDGWQIPELYQSMDGRTLVKFCINLEKAGIDLSQRHPVEKKSPEIEKAFDYIRQNITGTTRIVGGLICNDGVRLQIYRERKADAPKLLPEVATSAFSPALLDAQTVAFVTSALPLEIFWHAAKHDTLQKSRRKWREIESRLDELFDWQSFEKDIVPAIGPQAAIWLQLPNKPGTEISLPYLNLALRLAAKTDFEKPFEKLWKFLQDSQASRNVKRSVQTVSNQKFYQLQFKNTPVDHLLHPSYAFTSPGLIVSSHADGLRNLFATIKGAQESQPVYFYAYLQFSRLAELITANLAFLEKKAQENGKPFEMRKAKLFLELLANFQSLNISLRDEGKWEILEARLQMVK